jgi:hypothetical protein
VTIRTFDLWLAVWDRIGEDEQDAQARFCAAMQTLYDAKFISYPYTGVAALPISLVDSAGSRADGCEIGDQVPACYLIDFPYDRHGLVPMPREERSPLRIAHHSVEGLLFREIESSFIRHHQNPDLHPPEGETHDHRQMTAWRMEFMRATNANVITNAAGQYGIVDL